MIDEYEDQELDEDLMKQFSGRLEDGINEVLKDNPEKDPRLELLTTLLSFASQVALDIGIDEPGFEQLCLEFYQDSANQVEEEYMQSIAEPKKSKGTDKPN